MGRRFPRRGSFQQYEKQASYFHVPERIPRDAAWRRQARGLTEGDFGFLAR
jgi:hypothetical protein